MTKQNTAKAAQAADLRQRAARARDAAGRFIRRLGPVDASFNAGKSGITGSRDGEPDPVHALIEEHRAAYAEWDRDALAFDAILASADGYEAADAAERASSQRERAAYDALFQARPGTVAGVLALAEYLEEAVPKVTTHIDPTDEDRALGAIAAALRGIAPHPDAALFALGAQFMAAWVAEEANGDEPEYRACSRIATKIMRTPAATVEGYGIKALLLARLDSDATGPHAPIAPSGPVDSWWNVLRQVQQGAARLAGAAVAGIPVTGGLIEDRLPVPDHGLSALSIVELARLYPVIVRADEVLGSAESAPCFWSEDRTARTSAGQIVNREADRLSQFASAIAKEIGRRQPTDDNEAEERANTLLSHMVLSGGVAEHPALLAEINATWGA